MLRVSVYLESFAQLDSTKAHNARALISNNDADHGSF